VSSSPINYSARAGGWFGNAGNIRIIRRVVINADAKVGNTAGWVIGGTGSDAAIARLASLPAGQTGSTLVVGLPIIGIGEEITAFSLVGAITSGGNAVTVDAQLRRLSVGVGTVTDALISPAMTQVSVTANASMSNNATGTPAGNVNTNTFLVPTGATELEMATVAELQSFYLLITATTGAGCTVSLTAIEMEFGR